MATKAPALCGALPSPPCCGCCSCALAATLRYSLSGDPESLRTPLKPYAATLARAAFSLLPLLPSRASALLVCWSPLACFPPRPRCGWSCLPASLSVVLVGVCGFPPLWFWFGLLAWLGFLLGWVCLVFLCVGGFGLFSLFRASRLLALPDVSLDWDIRISAFTCTTKVLIDHCACVSVSRLDSFTCTVEFRRSTTSYLSCFSVTIRWVLRWGWLMIVDPNNARTPPLDLLPLSSFVGLGGLLIRLCFCFGLAVLLLGPSSTYLLFCKGVGCGRPEPWTWLLQRVALVRTSGTLCWTVWSAREQQSLRTWIVSFFLDQRFFSWPTRRESGLYSGFQADLSFCYAAMHCSFLLRRRHSGSTWTVLQIFSVWRRRNNAYFDDVSVMLQACRWAQLPGADYAW